MNDMEKIICRICLETFQSMTDFRSHECRGPDGKILSQSGKMDLAIEGILAEAELDKIVSDFGGDT
jgi:hypothetical protein